MSWLLAFIGFALLIVLHEFGHFTAAKLVGMRVERFMLFFPPVAWKVKRGETEYGVGTIPLGGYVRITGMNPNEEIPEEHLHRAYYKQKVWKRVVVIAAGPAVNLLIAFVILWVLVLTQGTFEITKQVDVIERGAPAAGLLQPGDELVSVDGVTGEIEALSEQIGTHRCAGTPVDGCKATTPAQVVVERDGRQVALEVTPVYDAERERTRLGFSFATVEQDAGPVEAADRAVSGIWEVTTLTFDAVTGIFYSAEKRDQVGSVVGGFETTRQVLEVDYVRALEILAIISLSLAIINLFPFLPLDGGHIFWALSEKIRGRPIPFAVLERASVVGFMLVIFVFVIGLSNDIERIRGEGFGIR